jgi:hypothetical protein
VRQGRPRVGDAADSSDSPRERFSRELAGTSGNALPQGADLPGRRETESTEAVEDGEWSGHDEMDDGGHCLRGGRLRG